MLKVNLAKIPVFDPVHVIDRIAKRVSFCVWGTKPIYIVGAIHNAILAKTIYKDWICRYYIEEPTQLINVLISLDCEVFVTPQVNFSVGYAHPLIWRFLALQDPLVDYVIFRDADSRINDRERVAVEDWLASGKSFHRMKESDHLNDPPILSGMWGAKAESLRNITNLVCSYKQWVDIDKPLPGDFYFLENKIWPIIKDSVLFHGVDSDRYGVATPFPPHNPIDCGFVGARVADRKWGF